MANGGPQRRGYVFRSEWLVVVRFSNGEHPAWVRSLDHWSRRVPALSMSRGSASGSVVSGLWVVAFLRASACVFVASRGRVAWVDWVGCVWSGRLGAFVVRYCSLRCRRDRASVAGVVELAAFPVLIVLVCPVFSVVCPWWSGAWVGLGVDFGRRGGRLACFLSSPLSPLDRLVIRRVCHGTCSGR